MIKRKTNRKGENVVKIIEKYYFTCPVCNKVLFKYEGICKIDIKCSKCGKEWNMSIDEKQKVVREKIIANSE